MAAQLLDIAKQRRNRIAMNGLLKKHQEDAVARKAEADALTATRPGLQQKLDQAQNSGRRCPKSPR